MRLRFAVAVAPLTPLASVLICGLLATPVQARVTFVSSDVGAFTKARLREGNALSQQTSSDTAFTVRDVFAEGVSVVHNGPADQSSIHAASSGAFTDATAGTIEFRGAGSMDTTTRPDSPFASTDWLVQYAYDFTIDQAELFTLDYSVLNSATPLDPSDGFVLFDPYQFKLTNAVSGVVATGSFSSGDSGRIAMPLGFDASIVQSGDYHLEVSNFTSGFLSAQTSAAFNSTGDFAFEIGSRDASTAGVPEPASWTMLIAGFAGVGFASRRARRTALRAGA